jgi:hypothetical protein
MNAVWQKAGDRIRDALGQAGYETWIGPLTFVGLPDKTATIEAPNASSATGSTIVTSI